VAAAITFEFDFQTWCPATDQPALQLQWQGRCETGGMFHPGSSHKPSAICVFHGKIGSEGHFERGAAMLIQLHKQATTTPKFRAAIHASDAPASILAERFGSMEGQRTIR